MQGADLISVSQRWQSRIAASPDYVIVPHDNVFRMGMHSSTIGESTFEQFGRYLHELCTRYSGTLVEDAIPGTVLTTDEGKCYCIQSTEPIHLTGPLPPDPLLKQEMRLVRGIGPKTAVTMRERGCQTIPDLRHHRMYINRADHVLSVLESGPAGAGYLIRTRLGPSHPLGLIASEGFDPAGFRFIDLETLGIFGRPVILFGVGCPDPDGLKIHQILLRDISEEPAALCVIRDLLEGASALVSYNGRSFDWPYLQERCAYYGFDPLPELPHIDLLHYSRRFWKGIIPDCKLSSIERHFLHIGREVDIPGMLVPEWYIRYLETGNCGPLVPIVKHNQQDIASLVHLLNLLRRKARECC
ncbi:MAG: exonuclease [Methanomicrobiales archaeon HGW-Methanomicrobiales-4]|nr:MAG: exonuclease [Methanomicrobiales archaeon HGW-Methanomicrobiales-4]